MTKPVSAGTLAAMIRAVVFADEEAHPKCSRTHRWPWCTYVVPRPSETCEPSPHHACAGAIPQSLTVTGHNLDTGLAY